VLLEHDGLFGFRAVLLPIIVDICPAFKTIIGVLKKDERIFLAVFQ